MYKYQTRLCNPLSFTIDESGMVFNKSASSNAAIKMKQARFSHDKPKILSNQDLYLERIIWHEWSETKRTCIQLSSSIFQHAYMVRMGQHSTNHQPQVHPISVSPGGFGCGNTQIQCISGKSYQKHTIWHGWSNKTTQGYPTRLFNPLSLTYDDCIDVKPTNSTQVHDEE